VSARLTGHVRTTIWIQALQGQCRPHNEKFRAGERRQEDCFGRGSNTRLLKNTFSNYNNFTADEVNLNEMELSLSLHFPLPRQTLFHKYLSRAKMTPLHDSRPNRHATHEILQKTMKITEEHFHSDAGETPAPTHHSPPPPPPHRHHLFAKVEAKWWHIISQFTCYFNNRPTCEP